MQALVARARDFAIARHQGQKRKYDEAPYSEHLDAVVGLLERHGHDDPVLLAAAFLHDTIEDTPTKVQDLLAAFDAQVAELVYWLSDMEVGNRRSRTLMSAWRLGRAPFDAKIIKCADIIDNTRNIGRHDPHFARIFAREKQLVLTAMAEFEGDRLRRVPLYQEAAATAGEATA